MRKMRFLLPLLVLVTLLTPFTSHASKEQQKVYDEANLLSKDEARAMEELCNKYGTKEKIDIVIVTTNDLKGSDTVTYLEDFYDNNGFGFNKKFGDTVLLLISVEDGHRRAEIQGYGKCEKNISNADIESILDGIIPLLSDGYYYQGFIKFVKLAVEKNSVLFFETGFQLLIAFLIGGITVLIMVLGSGGKVTITSDTYLEHDKSRILAKEDQYLRTTVTKRRKPEDNDSSSGGGGGVSSGGHSHSGGGRDF